MPEIHVLAKPSDPQDDEFDHNLHNTISPRPTFEFLGLRIVAKVCNGNSRCKELKGGTQNCSLL